MNILDVTIDQFLNWDLVFTLRYPDGEVQRIGVCQRKDGNGILFRDKETQHLTFYPWSTIVEIVKAVAP